MKSACKWGWWKVHATEATEKCMKLRLMMKSACNWGYLKVYATEAV